MNCAKFETDVARYAGGDLPRERVPGIEAHLAQCADCRELIEELQAERESLVEFRDDALPDALVAQLHDRVMSELKGGAGYSLRETLVPLFAVAAALILAVILLWPTTQVKRMQIARVETPRAVAAPPLKISAAPQPVAHRRHRAVAPREPGPPLLVQFVTDNPNIVIYWLVDQKPQGD